MLETLTQTEAPISSVLRLQSRYLRSVHLSRDFKDPSSLDGYIVTDQVRQSLGRIASGLAADSGHRAWRITGDYGSGKSSLALLLAHLFSRRRPDLRPELQRVVDFDKLRVLPPRLLPILITGSREPLSSALLRSLYDALLGACPRGQRPKVVDDIGAHLAGLVVADSTTLALVHEVTQYLADSGVATGILIVLDELGKFLEFAAQHPERQDVYLLQGLAEAAARSGDCPLMVVGLLHQGFNAYADHLSLTSQREWEKVAGRFEELLFNQPLDQVVGLVADALNVDVGRLPQAVRDRATADMSNVQRLKWYGAASSPEYLADRAARLYPLHPTVVPALLALFGRFGQNERSLFSFLLSDEPFGLRDYADAPVVPDHFYRLHDLYDYARATFGHRIAIQSYRSHWNQIDAIVAGFDPDNAADDLESRILKAVGLLNLLDSPTLLASPEVIELAVSDGTEEGAGRVARAVRRLHEDRHVLYYRGAAGGYCLWPYTSVNLERAYDDARRALGSVQHVAALVQVYVETRPLVARRHYITTGNLRHFDVLYTPVDRLAAALDPAAIGAAGRIVIPLCETEEERREAVGFALSTALVARPDVLIGIPCPLGDLVGPVQEAQRWRWVAENTPELANDTHAAEEVDRQVTASRQSLERRVYGRIGVQQAAGQMELQWFRQGEDITGSISNRRHLLSLLSDICDRVYDLAPRLSNELLNRRSISTAAATARFRLIDLILTSSSEKSMGLDPESKPPEMSMYLSVLKQTGLHRETDQGWALVEPDPDPTQDPYRIGPALRYILQVLEGRPDGRVPVSDLFYALGRPPYGVSDGVAPVLLAVFAVIHARHVAFYENGSFLQDLTGNDFRRLLKAPGTFEIQYCKVIGVRAELFDRLAEILGLPFSTDRRVELLDVVRPLLVFAARLPEYTRRTKTLSDRALNVRSTLVQAREPAPLIFRDLPEACGLEPFDGNLRGDDTVHHFIVALKGTLDELAAAYPTLKHHIKVAVASAFDMIGPFQHIRSSLAERAEIIATRVGEARLKSFCLTLMDDNLPENEWLESLGSFVCSKVPAKWTDADVVQFDQELSALCRRLGRVESIIFHEAPHNVPATAYHVSVTRADGAEVDHMLHVLPEEEIEVACVQREIAALLEPKGRIGLLAASRVFWDILSDQDGQERGSVVPLPMRQ